MTSEPETAADGSAWHSTTRATTRKASPSESDGRIIITCACPFTIDFPDDPQRDPETMADIYKAHADVCPEKTPESPEPLEHVVAQFARHLFSSVGFFTLALVLAFIYFMNHPLN